MADLPATFKALVCREAGKPLSLEDVTTPTADPGSVVVKILASLVEPNFPDVSQSSLSSLVSALTSMSIALESAAVRRVSCHETAAISPSVVLPFAVST